MKKAVSRRDFIKGAAVVAASGLLAGCGGGDAPSSSSTASNIPGNSSGANGSSSNSSSGSASEASSGIADDGIKWKYTKTSANTATLKGVDPSSGIRPTGKVTLPSKVDGYTITTVGNSAFKENMEITGIIFPDTVVEVEAYAFSGCKRLVYVQFSKNLAEMGKEAFRGDAITELIFPQKQVTLGDEVFEENEQLERVEFQGKVNLGNYDFGDCTALKTAVFSDDTEFLRAGTFFGCANLVSVRLPKKLRFIGEFVFLDCESLSDISIPEGVENVEEKSFWGCKALKAVTIPGKVKLIRQCAFRDCESLETVKIEDGVEGICEWAFAECKSLKNITIPNSVSEIDNAAFLGCEALEEITIPSKVSNMVSRTFEGCKSLRTVNLQQGLNRVNGFEKCIALRKIVLPKGLTKVGADAFAGDTAMRCAYIPRTVVTIYENAFFNCTGLKDIYYEGSEANWKMIDIEGTQEMLVNATKHYNATPDALNMVI